MTAQTRTTLKANFEDGDVPTGSNYADMIDSFVSLVDATAQSQVSNMQVPGVVTTIISANSGYYNTLRCASPTGGFYAASANVDVAYILQAQIDNLSATNLSATTGNFQRVSASSMSWTGIASGNTLNVGNIIVGTVSATTINATNVTAAGLFLTTSFNWNGETTVKASVGTATTPLPLTAQGFIVANIGGISMRIPYFRG